MARERFEERRWAGSFAFRSSGGLAAFIGALVLSGWAFAPSALLPLFFGSTAMVPNTALAFVCLGAAAWASAAGFSARREHLIRWGALIAGAIAAASLLEYFLGVDLGIDQLLLRVPLGATAGAPGRMAPDAAICFLLLAAALRLKGSAARPALYSVAAIAFSLLAAAFGLAALIVRPIFGGQGWLGATSMAVPTAALFTILGACHAASLFERGGADWALDLRATAAFAAGLVIAASVGLSMSAQIARMAELLGRAAGDRSHWIALSGTFGSFAALAAGLLLFNGAELRRRRAEEDLRKSRELFRDLFVSSRDAMMTGVNPDGPWLAVNPAAVAMFRAEDEADLRARGPAELSPPFQPDGRPSARVVHEKSEALMREGPQQFEWTHRRLNGEEFLSEVRLTRVETGGRMVVLAAVRDLAEISRAEFERRLLAAAVEQTPETIVITDATPRILYVNPAFERVTGYSREEALGKNPSVLKSGRHDRAFYAEMWATLSRGETWQGHLFNRRKDGTVFEEDCLIAPVRDGGGKITHYIAVKRDISRERALETQFLHSQRMEVVGRLAGGVAHDFNNILTAILGSAQLILPAVSENKQAGEDVAAIIESGMRAAALTRQLLAFSRRQPVENETFDLAAAVAQIQRMLKTTMGEGVRLEIQTPSRPIWIRADRAQIDQVMLNLAVNARDAMPQGGALALSASETELASPRVAVHDAAPAGLYAVLRCVDAGVGMSGEVLSHLFEPFFTTKEKGKGTGLGLSTVYGIVKQAGGHLFVESAPGRGTVFEILFPLAPPPPAKSAAAPAPASSARSETILLVEDEDAVLKMVLRTLKSHGYTVLVASNAEEAQSVAAAHRGRIDLLLTDVIMPGMSGFELGRVLAARLAGLKILYMSGYPDEAASVVGASKRDILKKPFQLSDLAARVRRALDGAAA